MQSAVVLLSGGLDSSILLHHVRKSLAVERVVALTFDYGQKHILELDMARRQATAAGVSEHRIVDISFFGALTAGGSALTDAAIAIPDLSAIPDAERDQPPTYVPNRNMVLLSIAAAYAESVQIRDVFYGAQQHDRYGYWDCTPDFLERLNAALELNRRQPVRVHAPFLLLRKADEVRLGMKLGVDFAATWSCYRGRRPACGTCPTCVERQAAFAEAGVADPVSCIQSTGG